MMSVPATPTRPFRDQKPGTAGLRKSVAVFRQPGYLENFIQSVFDTRPSLRGGTLVIGGDGRHFNGEAIAILLRMAAANGVRKTFVGRRGLLSTPAASLLIPAVHASGGFILTASHNPGGPDGDFGIKFNIENGGQASESLTDAIHRRTLEIDRYFIQAGSADISLEQLGRHRFGGMEVEVVDPVDHYASVMERCFDFERIGAFLRSGRFRMKFDALNAVTGPYAAEIFLRRLGAPQDSLLHAEPRPDFGGFHPDPNPHDAAELMRIFSGSDAPDFGAASDGDGDRNMILGPGLMVSPCDSLAILAANAQLVPGYRAGLAGVARSMPTSRAVDRVAAHLGIPCYETPTGWRFFCNLLDAGKVTLCGEESFGTSSNHAREKDGVWAVLFWLNLLAVRDLSVRGILREHWSRFGRDYFVREDYFIPEADVAARIVHELQAALPALPGQSVSGIRIRAADNFAYEDPVDGSTSRNQGIRIFTDDGGRIVCRLSGTGTQGATLRVYLERHEPDSRRHDMATSTALADLSAASRAILRLEELSGLTSPTSAT